MFEPIAVVTQQRLARIAQARRAIIDGERLPLARAGIAPADHGWIERSWRRCLALGHRPGDRVGFDAVPAAALNRIREANQALLAAARPVLGGLARATAPSRYFVLMTDANGVVIATEGAIDMGDRRARVIARVGVDLSERRIGTSAIGAALAEQHPVWLHRGEHFFDDTGCYSCAGAPLYGPDGRCIGMLDLTGVDAVERPELRHLVAQAARDIGDALVRATPAHRRLRLNWPSHGLGGDSDGLLALDADGCVLGANEAARQMLPTLGPTADGAANPVHLADLFALPAATVLSLRESTPLQVPLWSGLRVLVQTEGDSTTTMPLAPCARTLPLKALETELIQQALVQARGNVMAAARALGVSRATVYRRLAQQKPGRLKQNSNR